MAVFGARLKEFRDARGWSQERVGFEVEVTKATVSKWETGRAEPSLANLAKLRRLFAPFGATLDYLIDEQVTEAPRLRVRDGDEPVHPMREARSNDEVALLARYRALAPTRKRGLLDLLTE